VASHPATLPSELQTQRRPERDHDAGAQGARVGMKAAGMKKVTCFVFGSGGLYAQPSPAEFIASERTGEVYGLGAEAHQARLAVRGAEPISQHG
jgi:hypothetical protein